MNDYVQVDVMMLYIYIFKFQQLVVESLLYISTVCAWQGWMLANSQLQRLDLHPHGRHPAQATQQIIGFGQQMTSTQQCHSPCQSAESIPELKQDPSTKSTDMKA